MPVANRAKPSARLVRARRRSGWSSHRCCGFVGLVRSAGQGDKRLGDRDLHRMLSADIAAVVTSEVLCEGQEIRVLAGAVVVQLVGRLATADQAFRRRGGMRWRMHTAFERVSSSPTAVSMAETPATCAGSPPCEACESASSRARNPKASAAPDSTIGSAWMAFTAETEKDGLINVAERENLLPRASTTTKAPRWRLSTCTPRVTIHEDGIVHGRPLAALCGRFHWHPAE